MEKNGKLRLSGAIAGAINGLFGGGGGIPLVLLLTRWTKMEEKTALATCVAAILPCCIVSAAVFFFRGALDLLQALPYLLGGAAGGFVGGRLFKNVPTKWLRRIFALFLLYGAARYLGVVK